MIASTVATLYGRIVIAACALLASGLPSASTAQSYPHKPIRLIVPFGPGGPGDAIGRNAEQKTHRESRPIVVVDNRSGATTIVGTQIAAESPADGYTLLLISTTHAVNPSLFKKLPYDPIKDFTPVTLITATPFMLVVHPSVAANSVAELVALARSKPGQFELRFIGQWQLYPPHDRTPEDRRQNRHDACALQRQRSGLHRLDGRQVQLLFSSTVSSLPHVKTGKVRGWQSRASNARPRCQPYRRSRSLIPASSRVPGSGCWSLPGRRHRSSSGC
jgi:tripartite-type tricarboxylate transporter receptor subunit TctC